MDNNIMAYSDKEKTKLFDTICNWMEGGSSLRAALLQEGLPAKTFYEWIDADKEKGKQYARACEARADKLVDEILDIADETSHDTKITDFGAVPDNEWISRSKLRVDARKWLVSKLNPKKYGDKLDLTSDGEKISMPPTFTVELVESKPFDE